VTLRAIPLADFTAVARPGHGGPGWMSWQSWTGSMRASGGAAAAHVLGDAVRGATAIAVASDALSSAARTLPRYPRTTSISLTAVADAVSCPASTRP
jgi:hypothetical protein